MQKLPTLAIVGRPNVGKSALFNRIVGRRAVIVHDQAGTTRDCIEGRACWATREFRLLDTAGVGWRAGEKISDDLTAAVREQILRASHEADALVLVVDARDGLVPQDREVADALRRTQKPVLLAVNKADNPALENVSVEFAELGYEPFFPISALHGRGVEKLLDAAVKLLPTARSGSPAPSEERLKIVIVGRPNVGKSSLINRLVAERRLIVSPLPGTTRDAINVPCTLKTNGDTLHAVLIDTAGIRRTKKIRQPVEYFSVRRAEDSIQRADIAVLVLDAEQGITKQDKTIAGQILKAGKGCVIAVNKWDLIRKPVQKEFLDHVGRVLFFLDYAHRVFVSAHTGFGFDRLAKEIARVTDSGKPKISTGQLNRILAEAAKRRAWSGSSRFKIFYATQKSSSPPTFILFVNKPRLWTPAAEKYLAAALRAHEPYVGWPIRFDLRAKKSVQESER